MTDKFKEFIFSNDYKRVIFDEYKYKLFYNDKNERVFIRSDYKLSKLKNINFPEILLNLISELIDKIKLEIIIEEIFLMNSVNYKCKIKSDLEHYKYIEKIYYNFTLNCDNNRIYINTSIEKKFNDNEINEFDKIFLEILLNFVKDNLTNYIKLEIFDNKFKKINLRSFVLDTT